MNLSTLSGSIDPVILDRGRDYVSLGYVRSIKESENGVYVASVRGSELYEVVVRLDDEDEVLSLECDCPYDFGPVCKHQAAVLLELREERRALPQQRVEASDRAAASAPDSSAELRAVLESAGKERLVALLASLAEESEMIERRIRLSLSSSAGRETVDQCRQLIRSSIRLHSDDYGFVEWRAVNRAVEGAGIAAEKSLQAAANGDVMTAAAIDLCIIEEMVDLLQSADDSSGTIGGEVGDSLKRLQNLVAEEAEWPAEDRQGMMNLLLGAAEQPRLAAWTDWQLGLLQTAFYLAVTSEALRNPWYDALTRISNAAQGNRWSIDYLTERLDLMKYEMLQATGRKAAVRQFLQDRLHHSEFRKRAIQRAKAEGHYDEAIRLTQDGEEQAGARGLPGLVNQWKQHRYELYKLSGQAREQQQLGIDLLLQGDYAYYAEVKEICPPSEWPQVYREMLNQLRQSGGRAHSLYTQILVEERETDLLFAYVAENPSSVEQYYTHLAKSHREEILPIFRDHITSKAKHASSRSHYQDVCRVIRMLKKVGGQVAAGQMVSRLLAQYPNKPAFRDELQRV